MLNIDTSWIVTLGAACGAIFSVVKILQLLYTVISNISDSNRTILEVKRFTIDTQSSLQKVGEDVMAVQEERKKSTERLEKNERDVQQLRIETELQARNTKKTLHELREDISDLKELIKENTSLTKKK